MKRFGRVVSFLVSVTLVFYILVLSGHAAYELDRLTNEGR